MTIYIGLTVRDKGILRGVLWQSRMAEMRGAEARKCK
jgi:hypothetical protein